MGILCTITYSLYLLVDGILNSFISFVVGIVLFSCILMLTYRMTISIFDLWENTADGSHQQGPVYREAVIIQQTIAQISIQGQNTPANYPFTVETPTDEPTSSKRISLNEGKTVKPDEPPSPLSAATTPRTSQSAALANKVDEGAVEPK